MSNVQVSDATVVFKTFAINFIISAYRRKRHFIGLQSSMQRFEFIKFIYNFENRYLSVFTIEYNVFSQNLQREVFLYVIRNGSLQIADY